MSVFDGLTMIGGLCLFLFGMNIMGQALEKRAGSRLRTLLGKMTGRKAMGFLTGLLITAIIQSSSATTVMVVGFVNSSLLSLRQAINVIIGANVGTTVTAWILSLSGIDSSAIWLKLLKPTSFTPVLALVGIILHMFCKDDKQKDTGLIFLGFATLMFGMDTMSNAVSGLKDVPAFQNLFLLFTNPILGVLAGALLTAILQSSSASVGILQAFALTGSINYGAAIPIIMGQNIGTCITAILSGIGANKNAKRAAMIHLLFNVLGTIVGIVLFYLARIWVSSAVLELPTNMLSIAVIHSIFNVLCTVILLPLTGLLEKIALILVPDKVQINEKSALLDERLLATPSLALERCHTLVKEMGQNAQQALSLSLDMILEYDPSNTWKIRELENQTDQYEDLISTYIIKLSALQLSGRDSEETTALLKHIGDFERIADHAVDILQSAEEMKEKDIHFTLEATKEYSVMKQAIQEILSLSMQAFYENDLQTAIHVEPLEQVVDNLKEQLRTRHILRLKSGECSAEAGFVWSDLLTSLERTADHCSNVAGCVMDMSSHKLTLHDTLRKEKSDENEAFNKEYNRYADKYAL